MSTAVNSSTFADKLETVAGDFGNVPRHELAVLLRRAAIIIRSKPQLDLSDEDEAALERYAADLGSLSRNDALVRAVREALMSAGYMRVYDLQDEFEQGLDP